MLCQCSLLLGVPGCVAGLPSLTDGATRSPHTTLGGPQSPLPCPVDRLDPFGGRPSYIFFGVVVRPSTGCGRDPSRLGGRAAARASRTWLPLPKEGRLWRRTVATTLATTPIPLRYLHAVASPRGFLAWHGRWEFSPPAYLNSPSRGGVCSGFFGCQSSFPWQLLSSQWGAILAPCHHAQPC